MEGKTNILRHLKQFDGLTWLTLTPVILRQMYAAVSEACFRLSCLCVLPSCYFVLWYFRVCGASSLLVRFYILYNVYFYFFYFSSAVCADIHGVILLLCVWFLKYTLLKYQYKWLETPVYKVNYCVDGDVKPYSLTHSLTHSHSFTLSLIHSLTHSLHIDRWTS